jgi:hypothetical protein
VAEYHLLTVWCVKAPLVGQENTDLMAVAPSSGAGRTPAPKMFRAEAP